MDTFLPLLGLVGKKEKSERVMAAEMAYHN